MHRFFVPAGAKRNQEFQLEGDTAHHLASSLRAQPGEMVVLVTAHDGTEYGAQLLSISRTQIIAKEIWSRPGGGEPDLQLNILQALSKDGMDEAVDAVVASGAAAIWPVITERTVVQLDEKRALQKREHWQKIALASAQVAWRSKIPEVRPVMALKAALSQIGKDSRVWACDFGASATSLAESRLGAGRKLALVIGPEGGLGDGDRELLRDIGAQFVHLGPRVWRSRNAAAVAATMVMTTHKQLIQPVRYD